jgi:hypothetical protein
VRNRDVQCLTGDSGRCRSVFFWADGLTMGHVATESRKQVATKCNLSGRCSLANGSPGSRLPAELMVLGFGVQLVSYSSHLQRQRKTCCQADVPTFMAGKAD